MQIVQKKRKYWQSIRGICMLVIVLIHCGTTTELPFTSFDGTYYFFIRSFYSFAVSTLFFMAGKFTKISHGDMRGYFKKRLKRILLPYLVWSGIYLLFGVVRGNRYSEIEIIRILLTGDASIPFYYSVVLLSFTLLTPVFLRLIEWKRLLYLCIGGTITFMTGGYCSQYFAGNVVWVKLTPIWLCFYIAGLQQGNGVLHHSSTVQQAAIIWISAYVIQIIETFFLLQNEKLAAIAYSQWHFGAFLYAAATINLMLAVEKRLWFRKSLAYIGDRSYGIYFIHCLFLSILAGILNRIHIAFPLPILRALQFATAVGGSLIVIFVLKKSLRRHACSWFGV